MMVKECNKLTWERHAYGTSKDVICNKEKIKRNNLTKQHKNV